MGTRIFQDPSSYVLIWKVGGVRKGTFGCNLFITFQPYRAENVKRIHQRWKRFKDWIQTLDIMESYFQAHSVQQRTISGSAPWRQGETKAKELSHCLTGWPNSLNVQYAWIPSRIPQYTSAKGDMRCAKLAEIHSKLKTNHVQSAVESLLIPEIWLWRTCWSSCLRSSAKTRDAPLKGQTVS